MSIWSLVLQSKNQTKQYDWMGGQTFLYAVKNWIFATFAEILKSFRLIQKSYLCSAIFASSIRIFLSVSKNFYA